VKPKPQVVLESAAAHTRIAVGRAGFRIGVLPSAAIKALDGAIDP